MPHATLSSAVARARRAACPDTATDGALLGAFLDRRDADAFAALVSRFGPMVFAVCRKLTGAHHDAEDAFQAAFVVLARKAATVSPREAVGNWLYGVAVRVAKEARTVRARQRSREVPTSPLPEPATHTAQPDDLSAVLHEELAQLPAKFRELIVACDLRGEPQQAVAERLGVPVGTVYSRLSAGRAKLAERLKARGVALSASALANAGSAAPPTAVASAAVAAGLAPDSVSAAVAALSNGAIGTMFVHKLLAGVACAALVVVLALALPGTATEPNPAPRPGAFRFADEPKAKAAPKPGTLIVAREGAFWVMGPDGKNKTELAVPEKHHAISGAAFSPDGKRVAFVACADEVRVPARPNEEPKPWPLKVIVRAIDKADGATEVETTGLGVTLMWSADGKKLFVSKAMSVRNEAETLVVDSATGKAAAADLPPNVMVLDRAPDGKSFLVQAVDVKAKKAVMGLAKLGDKEVTPLIELRDRGFRVTTAKFSPSGKTVLYIDADPDRKNAHKWGMSQTVYTLNVDDKKRERLPDFPENARAGGIAWSPDGKKIAYSWQPLDDEILNKDAIGPDDIQKETEGFLIVCDADGSNAATVATDKVNLALNRVFGGIDWR